MPCHPSTLFEGGAMAHRNALTWQQEEVTPGICHSRRGSKYIRCCISISAVDHFGNGVERRSGYSTGGPQRARRRAARRKAAASGGTPGCRRGDWRGSGHLRAAGRHGRLGIGRGCLGWRGCAGHSVSISFQFLPVCSWTVVPRAFPPVREAPPLPRCGVRNDSISCQQTLNHATTCGRRT